MEQLKSLFEKNAAWAKEVTDNNPDFFSALSQQQKPDYLWIGCADSRVPANQIIDLPPGEVFVHRNIANVVVHTDLNFLSVLQYAVEVLQVKHVIVCGHYGCGGIKAAMGNQEHGLIDNWLRHIKDVIRFNDQELQKLDFQDRYDRLCELNVTEQVANVCNTTTIQNAWKKGLEVAVHGWIYDINNGILQDLGSCITSNEQLDDKHRNLWVSS